MHKIMAELHQDHVHLSRLLNLLDQQVEIIAAGDDPDLLLMSDIACYIRHYPDLVHHPKEDVVYQAFQKISGEEADMVECLLQEHQHLPAASQEFHEMLEAAANGSQVVKRSKLERKIREFIRIEREHINAEEETLFPLIEKTMSEEDWDRVDFKMLEKQDPLFGSNVEECYENLYQSIKSNQ